MSNKRISLIVKISSKKDITHLLHYKFKTIYCLVKNDIDVGKISSQRIMLLPYTDESEWKSIIWNTIKNNPLEKIIPYFRGDDNSKYAIQVHNCYNENTIDRRLFKHKNKMNDFMSHSKKFKFIKQEELKNISYEEISNTIWEQTFIIKPINKSSSAGAFKITNTFDRDNIQEKLLPCDHVAEEYYAGHLHSIDFYFDGEHILVLSAVREVPFIEILDENKHSVEFIEQYWKEIQQNFLFSLPIRYDIPYQKLHTNEREFITEIGKRLKAIGYVGFIHLEYKFDTTTKKIWYIERGARLWWERLRWIEHLHYFDIIDLLYSIHTQDISKRENYKWSYIFKTIKPNTHYVGIYKFFLKPTHIGEVLLWHKNPFKISYTEYLKSYFQKIGIIIQDINIVSKKSEKNMIYPSYKSNETYFKIMFEIDDENFKKLRSKKIEIIEKLVFL